MNILTDREYLFIFFFLSNECVRKKNAAHFVLTHTYLFVGYTRIHSNIILYNVRT